MDKGKSLINIIKTRTSVRKWKDKMVPKQLIQEVIECGLSAPSAYNAHPWQFIIVDNSQIIDNLLSDRMQLKDAPYYINSSLYIDKLGKEKYKKVEPPPLLIVICGEKEKCNNDIPGLIASLSCSGENMLLAAHALGLGAFWLYVHDLEMPETEQKVKRILSIPEELLVLCMLAIGYPKEKIARKKVRDSKYIHFNRW